jgi:hypothetical protein
MRFFSVHAEAFADDVVYVTSNGLGEHVGSVDVAGEDELDKNPPSRGQRASPGMNSAKPSSIYARSSLYASLSRLTECTSHSSESKRR